MAILDIVTYPDPRLREVSAKVTAFDKDLKTLLDNMAETMYAAPGIGLAAVQVGVMLQVAVVDVSRKGTERFDIVNPEIIAFDGLVPSEEGCLSIPEFKETIERYERITIKAQNHTGEFFEMQADELLAICMQHEIDHLNGILFPDHLSRLKREFFKKMGKENIFG